jgi:Bacterial Ig domain
MKIYYRKINNFSAIRISCVFFLVSMLMLGTVAFPLVTQTGAIPLPNNPPNVPKNPVPINGSANISILAKLNWTGGDPDGNLVKYDIYFGITNPPPKIISNQSNLSYNPGTMSYLTKYFWKIVVWDNYSASTNGPLWSFTTEPKPNTPPNTPSGPSPTNAATDVYVSALLSWTGGDPDGNPVKYDVYFGTASSPSKVINNQSTLSYDPPGKLAINTKYYWKIVAWDNHSASTQGPVWSFTTKKLPTVTITKPLENTLYVQDNAFLIDTFPLTFIYGPINITADANSGIDIKKVEFFVDGKSIGNDSLKPYVCLWNPTDLADDLTPTHIIKVIAYDKEDDNASAELSVIKWRFHPLPFIIAGGAIAGLSLLNFIPHTTVRGLFFDVQSSMFTTSFYAVLIHYSTNGPFRHVRGTIAFRSCTGSLLIGPIKMTRFGPFHNIAYGSFTFLGDIHYTIGSFGQRLATQLPATTLADLFPYLTT